MNTPARKFVLIVGAAALIFSLGLVSAVAWFDRQGSVTVRIRERGPNGSHVSVRFPAALIAAGLPFGPARELHRSPEYRQHRDLVQSLVRDLGAVPDCDLVTVEGPSEHVRLRKSGDLFIVEVQDNGDEVYLSIPARTLGRIAKWL